MCCQLENLSERYGWGAGGLVCCEDIGNVHLKSDLKSVGLIDNLVRMGVVVAITIHYAIENRQHIQSLLALTRALQFGRIPIRKCQNR